MLEEGLVKKFSYSESENSIVPVNSSLLPAFRKVNDDSATIRPDQLEQSQSTAKAKVAHGITAFFEKNANVCDEKTSEWCARSMESTQAGFTVHAKANVSVAKLSFDEKSILLPCYLIKVAGASLPTAMALEIKDDRGETRGYSGVCAAN